MRTATSMSKIEKEKKMKQVKTLSDLKFKEKIFKSQCGTYDVKRYEKVYTYDTLHDICEGCFFEIHDGYVLFDEDSQLVTFEEMKAIILELEKKMQTIKNFEPLKKCGFIKLEALRKYTLLSSNGKTELFLEVDMVTGKLKTNIIRCEDLEFLEVSLNDFNNRVIQMTKAGCFDEPVDKGEISDGYHTFNELYNHRKILFATIVNSNINKSWKSWKHEDDTMYDNYFIVGIETILGQFSYHYHKDSWDMFKCKEMKNAPKWDGHTSDDVTRLFAINEPVKTLSDLGYVEKDKNCFVMTSNYYTYVIDIDKKHKTYGITKSYFCAGVTHFEKVTITDELHKAIMLKMEG